MSEFSILKGVTVVILVTFGKIGLLFSVYNISKNYLTFNDSWIDIYKICQSVFFSSPVSHLNAHYLWVHMETQGGQHALYNFWHIDTP